MKIQENSIHFYFCSCSAILRFFWMMDYDIFLCINTGGTRIYERGEGDDDIGSIEDQFGEWKENLWHFLCKKYLLMMNGYIRTNIECEFDNIPLDIVVLIGKFYSLYFL